jgi:hypothetical protein
VKEDYSVLLYSPAQAQDGSFVTYSMQSLPSISDSDAAIIGTVTYTMIALLAYCKKTDTEACIDALSEVFCMNKKRIQKLYSDLAAVPCVPHVYNRNLQPELNPFFKQKAFENEKSVLETAKYLEYQESERQRTRTELLQVANTLYLTVHIHRYKVTVAPDPPHAAVGPAAKIDQRPFFVEVQVYYRLQKCIFTAVSHFQKLGWWYHSLSRPVAAVDGRGRREGQC